VWLTFLDHPVVDHLFAASDDADMSLQRAGMNADRDREEQEFFGEEQYERWRTQTVDVLGCLDRMRKVLEDRAAHVNARSLQQLVEDTDGVEKLRLEMAKVELMLRAAEKFVVGDLSRTLNALRRSLASVSEATRDKLGYRHATPGDSQGQLLFISTSFHYMLRRLFRNFI